MFLYWKKEWESLIKRLEVKIKNYNDLSKDQRYHAGSNFKNEYTAYWNSSVFILKEAVRQFSLLCDGYDSDLKKRLERRPDFMDFASYSIDDRALSDCSLVMNDLCVDDYGEGDIDPPAIRTRISDLLCPDDLT